MYVIVTYDIESERCYKAMKILRRYLFHRQNSVFVGSITSKELKNLKNELTSVIVEQKDEVIFYELLSDKYLICNTLGIKKESKYII